VKIKLLKWLKTNKTDSLLHLIILITFKCNLSCQHCCFSKQLNPKNRYELSLNDYRKIYHNISYIENLSIGGGEPFLRSDLLNIVQLFSKKTKNITIVTNGYFTDKIIDFLYKLEIKQKIHLFISLDGTKEVHNNLRSNEKSFNKVLETCDAINKNKAINDKIYLVIHTNISKFTVNDIDELLIFVKKNINPDIHTFELVRDNKTIFPDLIQLKEVINQISNFTEINYDIGSNDWVKLKRFFKNYLMKYFLQVESGKLKKIHCFADKFSAVVYPDGKVSCCEGFDLKTNINELNYDLKNICKIVEIKKMKKRIRNCYCTHACFQPYNLFLHPLYFLKVVLRGTC